MNMETLVVALSCGAFEGKFDDLLPARALFFKKWRSAFAHQFHLIFFFFFLRPESVHSDSARFYQRGESIIVETLLTCRLL